MGTFYVQRCDEPIINVNDKYKINIKSVTQLADYEEAELGKGMTEYNFIVLAAVHPSHMNLFSSFTTYISGKIKGQFDKNLRGELKNGMFQLIDDENGKGYRLTYKTLRDSGKKEGNWKLLELLFTNELPQATYDKSNELFIGNTPCTIFFSDGNLITDVQNRYIPYSSDWALVIPSNGDVYEADNVFSGSGFVDGSQKVRLKYNHPIISGRVLHDGTEYPIRSYDSGASWVMLKPLQTNYPNSKDMVMRFPVEEAICYYSKKMIEEIALPEGFELLDLKDVLNLQNTLGELNLLQDFYNNKTLYGFVEHLVVNTKIPRSAFWGRDNRGYLTGFQFIMKGERIVAERINVEEHTFLPVIGIYNPKN